MKKKNKKQKKKKKNKTKTKERKEEERRKLKNKKWGTEAYYSIWRGNIAKETIRSEVVKSACE